MMKQLSTGIIGACLLVSAVTVPVSAHSDHTGVTSAHGQEHGVEARQNARERVESIKQEVEQRHAQVMSDVCERRQERMRAAIPRLATRAVAVQDAFDRLYERVQSFYELGQLTVPDYDELNAEVAAAQADAGAATEVVAEFEFELDCDNPNVGEQLDGFRTAVAEAREALKDYRAALVGLISAMRAEAAEENSGDNADENNGEVDDEQG